MYDHEEIVLLDSQRMVAMSPMLANVSSAHPPSLAAPNNLLAQLAKEREERRKRNEQSTLLESPTAPLMSSHPKSATKGRSRPRTSPSLNTCSRQATILTWNVWFREDLALEERMLLGFSAKVVECGYPDFILVQECTPNILEIWTEKAPVLSL